MEGGAGTQWVENWLGEIAGHVTLCYILVVPIRFTPLAFRQFAKIDVKWRLEIEQKLHAYVLDPASARGSVKRLVGDGRLRMRVGDFRIIFKEDGTVLMVEEVGHRREIYRSK